MIAGGLLFVGGFRYLRPMKRLECRGAIVVTLLALPACQGLVDGAQEQFSKDNTCPIERVEARARADLRPSSFKTQSKPPAAIAADPDRLRMWEQKQQEAFASSDRRYDIAEAHGCGKDTFYECYRSSQHASSMSCSSESLVPPEITHW